LQFKRKIVAVMNIKYFRSLKAVRTLAMKLFFDHKGNFIRRVGLLRLRKETLVDKFRNLRQKQAV